MKQLIEVPSSDQAILIEVTSAQPAVRAVRNLDETIERSARSLAEGLDTIIAIARDFRKQLDVAVGLDSAELEFGLKLTAKGSVYVVETQGEASFNVKLTFKPPQEKKSGVA